MDQFSPQVLKEWIAGRIDQVSDAGFRQLLHQAIGLAGEHRTALPYWSCLAAGGSPSPQIVLSVTTVALLTRIALGVLDDYQDDEVGGLPCPLPQAMNVVVGLLSMVHSLLAEVSEMVPPDRLAQVQDQYGRALLQMCDGQHHELTNQHPLSLAEYQKLVGAKSVPQYVWECSAGALLSAAPTATVESLSRFGYHIGHLYQLANDYSGLRGLKGKSDIGRYWTWPTVYAWHVATPAKRNQFLAAWEQQDEAYIHQLIDDLKARQFLIGASLNHRRQALAALEQLPDNGNQIALESLRSIINELTLLPENLLAKL